MIGWHTGGLPRPVGSKFRQREVWAEDPSRYGHPDADHTLPWVVSVVETRGGLAIEAWLHLRDGEAIVATDPDKHERLHNVLARAMALLQEDDGKWRERKVQECRVPGCGNPVPMWSGGLRQEQGGYECMPCSLRTVQACRECGMPDLATYFASQRERVLAAGLCPTCDFWTLKLGREGLVIAEDWHVYHVGGGRSWPGMPSSCKGFGGHKFLVTFSDGREVRTDDLWSNGVIPEWFWDRFTPNARVESDPGAQVAL